MNPNSYRLQNDDEVDAADIAALLDELRDVGGSVEDPKSIAAGRPLSGSTVRRGTVGGTNVLKEQQRSGTAAPGLNQHRRSSKLAGDGDGNGHDGSDKKRTSASGSPVAVAGPLAPIGFSTYNTAEAALMEAQLQQQLHPQLSATPLGVRLAPLGHHAQTSMDGSAGQDQPSLLGRLPPSSPKRPLPLLDTPASPGGSATQRPPLTLQTALPPLPSLATRKTSTTDGTAAAGVAGRGGSAHLRMLPGVAEVNSSSSIPAATASGQVDSDNNVVTPREINFLPIMCARYLRPVGLVPTARWGHTLTPLGPDAMLLFGGLDVNGAETASLLSFNPTTISWEPLYTMSDGPIARHSHAACAYDNRYLIISGGVAQHGGRVLDDLYLYDSYTHHWRCVWDGERDGSPQNRNEPGPRFAHSIVLHEDRLFLYGGKTVPTEAAAAGGRRRGSSTSAATLPAFPSKASATVDMASTTAAATLVNGGDVCVFSLNSFRWRRRLHAAKNRRDSSAATANSADPNVSGEEPDGVAAELPTRPSPRAHHAACVRGTTLFIHGGANSTGVLTDTWALELTSGAWRCIHRGGTADAVPREKHALFVCGEALLLVGGCSGGGGLNERITGKFTNFAVVLPLVGAAVETPCWIPVAMGNLSIVSPGKKSFGAALSGGFVYVFGGVCGAEPATNTMVRFLAADGCISQNDQLTAQVTGNGAQQLRLMQQRLREQQRGTPYDFYAYAGTYGSVSNVAAVVDQLPAPWAGASSEEGQTSSAATIINRNSKSSKSGGAVTGDDVAGGSGAAIVGLHRAIVQQRAPLFLQELERCRSESYRVGSACAGGGGAAAGAGSVTSTPQKQKGSAQAGSTPGNANNNNNSNDGDASGDEVDALLREVGGGSGGGLSAATPQKNEGDENRSRGNNGGRFSSASAGGGRPASDGTVEGLPVYYTNGTTRIPGLAQPLTAEALQCLVDYIYWGGLKGKYRVLLEEEKDEADGAVNPVAASRGDGGRVSTENGGTSFSAEYRGQLVQTLQTVKAAAEAYQLSPLAELCANLLSGNREAMHVARQRCSEQLHADLAGLLQSPTNANTTMLVVDPHTKAKAAHVLHASMLMAASGLFTDLLRPLYRASAGLGSSKASNQVGPLAAKLSATAAQSPVALLTGTSKRTVLIGPVPLPLPAVKPILRYLYTQELQVSGELAFEVMLGAHQLGLTELQALCEAVVAREEVNYQTCCTFYYLSRKYQASLLEEIALLTAVSGFAEVRYTAAYQSLSDEEKQNIDAVARELGSSTWVPPSQPTQEIKSKAAYAARWDSSAPV